ncbi:hypothetical protein K7X08_013600 [Anisodus acutangulus]|uniref:Uncharacterized protein n=1 Tax=Anisodus acutangulus TaxID=402998 RepID=A0A9Q1R2A7_9SOLA|nr:hypothetical protein K7X08_013600 [Anisodus acutangulus]
MKPLPHGYPSPNPRVLSTHIPLYQPDLTACGPYRSSSSINQRINRAAFDNEILYQNYIIENGTNDLLDSIKPALILSGHDHDQCTVIHKTKYGSVKEHTLGTISWKQGNLIPSYMLLSASNIILSNGATPEEAISTKVSISVCHDPSYCHPLAHKWDALSALS